MVKNLGAWELNEIDISKVLEKISVEPFGDNSDDHRSFNPKGSA
jgi:hypothetical protein